MDSMRVLSLSANNLTGAYFEAALLPLLRQVIAHNARSAGNILSASAGTLPSAWSALQQLSTLDLNANKLTGVSRH